MSEMTQVRIRQEGTYVLVIVDGKTVINAPYNVALDIFREGIAASKRAEELAHVEGIVHDQAILIRAGAPFGLTNNTAMLREAVTEAGHNPVIRRHMPGGIKSKELVGTPEVHHA